MRWIAMSFSIYIEQMQSIGVALNIIVAVIDMHSYDISLIGTAEQLRELIDKLECCYKSIIEFQDNKDKESESK